MTNFKTALGELKQSLTDYLELYKQLKDDLGSKAARHKKRATHIVSLLKLISTLPNKDIDTAQISEIADRTRWQLETYLDAQEKHADLDTIELELDKLDQGLENWKTLKEKLEQENMEDEWNGIYEIAQQARQQINYLKGQKNQIILLIKDYQKVAKKNPNSPEAMSLKTQIEQLIKTSEKEVQLINN